MLCEKCHENQVSFIISASVDSSKGINNAAATEIQVCEECATTDMEHEISGTSSASGATLRECPQCHSRYLLPKSDMDRLLGCPFCYTEFREELTPRLRRIHGSTVHRGKLPIRRNVSGKSSRLPNIRAYTDLESRLPDEAEWMQGRGPDCDVVISTRIRLARNVSGHTFCNSAKESELQRITEIVGNAAVNVSERDGTYLRNISVIKVKDLDAIGREFLVERHLISRDLAEGNGTGEVIIGEKQMVSLMLNEEDHVRLQIINSGLQLRQSWEIISAIDDDLGQEIDYAFSDNWGYLTACPTNVGTGLRVSVMLHIPALAATREGNRVLSSISDMGYAVRGMYGEGSHATGAFYQISNEATLGQSEEEIVNRIRSLTRQITNRERIERRLLIEKNGVRAEDKIFRSYGTLMNARLISSREALKLLSWVSLGVNMEILSGLSRSHIARLLVLINPAHLQRYAGRELDAAARDMNRAAVIREVLNKDGR